MSATNHGSQQITWQYFSEATSANWGRRNLGILPVGIYSGGYFTKTSNTEISMSVVVAEISDGTNQVSVRTTEVAILNSTTLDSGAISSATPYLVFRWGYQSVVNNYVEIHALASVSNRQQNDLILGKCVFTGATLTGFDYSDRTFPSIQDQNLRVEATSETELYVRVRGGIVNTGSAKVVIGDQKVGPFIVPGGGNSRIDLVYVTSAGALAIQQGTAAVSPSVPAYGNKLVLAEVRVVNGDTNITWDRITDARAFLAFPQVSSTRMIESTGTDNITYSTAAWATIPNMSVNITTTGGLVHIVGGLNMRWATELYNDFRLRVDGIVQFTRRLEMGDSQGYIDWIVDFYKQLSSGVHTIDLQWYRVQANITQEGSTNTRYLQCVELG